MRGKRDGREYGRRTMDKKNTGKRSGKGGLGESTDIFRTMRRMRKRKEIRG